MTDKKSTPVLDGLVVGEYGKTHTLTLKDYSGSAQDVSSYTAFSVVFRSPDGTKTVSATGSKTTDGTDGKVSFSFSTGTYLDRDGLWEAQVEMTKTGYKTKSDVFNADVDKTLR